MPAYPGFIGSSSARQSTLADCERLINLYLEPNDVGSGRPALYPTPGERSFLQLIDVSGRALFTMNLRTLGVVGGGLYEFFSNQTAARYGTVAVDSNLAQITMNGVTGHQALFSSGGSAYVLDLLTNIATAALIPGEATQIGMLDGYGIAFNKTIGKIRLSNLNDFTVWDPTQFALRAAAPDNWVAMLVNAPDVILLGSVSGDVWFDAGNFPFPLAPRPGATFPYGCAATFSLAAAGDSVLWLSQNEDGIGPVVRMRGYTPQPISTYALDTAIAGYARTSRIDDAEALTYQKAGHTFYVLRFPAAKATWVYDLKTGQWHERGKWVSTANSYDVWNPRVITYAFGKHLTGNVTNGILAEMDETIGTELDGTAIVRKRIPPALAVEDGGRIFVDRFELGIEPGVGVQIGQGSDPQVMLRISRNFAKTWGNELMRSFGAIGDYDKRVFWNRLGSSPVSWVPEITISEPVPVRIVSASIEGRGFGQQGKAA